MSDEWRVFYEGGCNAMLLARTFFATVVLTLIEPRHCNKALPVLVAGTASSTAVQPFRRKNVTALLES